MTLRRRQLDRKQNEAKSSVYSYNALPVNCEQDWKLSATVQFLLSPYDGAPYIEQRHSSSWHHGLMSNSWLSNCGGTTPDDEETEPVKLYTPTMAQILL